MAKLLRPGAFLLALACFVLPFMRISCNNQMLMEPKGYQLAFGQQKHPADSTKISHDTKAQKANDIDIKMQPLILSAFIALALGLVFGLMGFKVSKLVQVMVSVVAIGMFTYFYFDYRHQMHIEDGSDNSGKNVFGDNMKIDVRFLYGYWLSIAFSFIALIMALLPLDKKKIIVESIDHETIETNTVQLDEDSVEI